MRCVVQRVSGGSVSVGGRVVSSIGRGLVAMAGIYATDTKEDSETLADKLANLRIFEDGEGKMNLSVKDVGGSVLLVPNFTVAGDARKGRRPSFDLAMRPEQAGVMFAALAELVRGQGVEVQTGVFRATMEVALVNDGPITIVVETRG